MSVVGKLSISFIFAYHYYIMDKSILNDIEHPIPTYFVESVLENMTCWTIIVLKIKHTVVITCLSDLF